MPTLRPAPGMGYFQFTGSAPRLVLPGEPGTEPMLFDATEDFSFSSNPSGTWRYGSLDSTFTNFTLSTTVLTAATVLVGWAIGVQLVVFKNTGSTTLVGIPPGALALHPIPSTDPGCLRWRAPTSFASLRVQGQFLAGDAAAPTQAIRRGTRVLYSQTTPGTFDLNLKSVRDGEFIDFIVYGTYNQSSTPIILTISGDGDL